MKKQYGFYIDTSKCSGCKTCQVACKDKNDLEVGILWRRVYEVSSGGWKKRNGAWTNNVRSWNVSLSCNHCEEPECVKVCPTKAMTKDKNGIVKIDKKRCIGCRYCEWACPYGAPQYDKIAGQMTKCDLCSDYLEEGKNPSCVDACPMRALDFGELKFLKNKYGENGQVLPLPVETYTSPSVVIKPHKDTLDADKNSLVILNKEEV